MTHDPTNEEIDDVCKLIDRLSGVKVWYDKENEAVVIDDEKVFHGTVRECGLIVSGMYLMAELQKKERI